MMHYRIDKKIPEYLTINKKIKSIIAVIGLSTTLSLLGGCGKSDTSTKVLIGNDSNNSELTYEENTLSGKISYNALERGDIRILTFSYDEKYLGPKLMGIHLDEHFQIIGGGVYYTLDYIDLEKSVIQLSYSYPNHYSEEEEPVVLIGENFEIEKKFLCLIIL